jgi:hypothetical protein
MSFYLSCWDCPVSIWVTLGMLALTITGIGVGLKARRSRRLAVRALAITAVGVSALVYLFLAVYIPRWGIDWNPGAMPWNPVALPERDRIVFWSAHIVLLAVVLFALVERRRADARG